MANDFNTALETVRQGLQMRGSRMFSSNIFGNPLPAFEAVRKELFVPALTCEINTNQEKSDVPAQ